MLETNCFAACQKSKKGGYSDPVITAAQVSSPGTQVRRNTGQNPPTISRKLTTKFFLCTKCPWDPEYGGGNSFASRMFASHEKL